jgi:hypothetical protein
MPRRVTAWILECAAEYLVHRGWGFEDADEEDVEQLFRQLRASAKLHPAWGDADEPGARASRLADWWESDMTDAYWASLPRATCWCGREYTVAPALGAGRYLVVDTEQEHIELRDEKGKDERCPCGIEAAAIGAAQQRIFMEVG